MANPGERSINIVTANKPKVLPGLSQKGTVAGTRIPPLLVMDTKASIMASATPFWCCATPKHLTAKSGMISKA